MREKSIVYEKSKLLALRIVKLYSHLIEEKKEYVISKQLLRSGTSIGANLAESICAISAADFQSKLYIALKESSETRYWLELLSGAGYLSQSEFGSIYHDVDEIFKMLTASTKTIRETGR